MKTNIKIKKIKIREEIDHLINIDASIGGYQFDCILVCSSENTFGRTWHMVIPNWEVNCRIGKNIFYNETQIKEALEPEMRFPEEYAAIIAKVITSRLNEHDKEIDEAIIKKYFQNDKDNE